MGTLQERVRAVVPSAIVAMPRVLLVVGVVMVLLFLHAVETRVPAREILEAAIVTRPILTRHTLVTALGR